MANNMKFFNLASDDVILLNINYIVEVENTLEDDKVLLTLSTGKQHLLKGTQTLIFKFIASNYTTFNGFVEATLD